MLLFGVSIPDTSYETTEQKIAYYDRLLSRLRALPGVKSAGATSAPPLGGHRDGQFETEGGRRAGAHGET